MRSNKKCCAAMFQWSRVNLQGRRESMRLVRFLGMIFCMSISMPTPGEAVRFRMISFSSISSPKERPGAVDVHMLELDGAPTSGSRESSDNKTTSDYSLFRDLAEVWSKHRQQDSEREREEVVKRLQRDKKACKHHFKKRMRREVGQIMNKMRQLKVGNNHVVRKHQRKTKTPRYHPDERSDRNYFKERHRFSSQDGEAGLPGHVGTNLGSLKAGMAVFSSKKRPAQERDLCLPALAVRPLDYAIMVPS